MLERSSAPYILKGTAATLAVTFYVDGVAADPGTVTVTITRADGTAVATDAATTGSGTQARSYALTPAQTGQLDLLTAVWTGTVEGVEQSVTTEHEIVGDVLFTLEEARNFGKKKFASAATYPSADILDARTRLTDEFELILDYAPLPRFREVLLSGDDSDTLLLPDRPILALRSVAVYDPDTATWDELDAGDLADIAINRNVGALVWDGGWFDGGVDNIRVRYECGLRSCPRALRDAALLVLEDILIPSNIDQRATFMVNDLGNWKLTQAGESPTAFYGIPRVDAVLARYRKRRRVVIA